MERVESFERRLDEALAADEPFTAVRALVVERRRQGETREGLYEILTAVLLRLREAGQDPEEDIVLDVMDQLVGWCSPDVRID